MRRAVDASAPAERQLWAGTLAFFRFVEERRAGWTVLYREAASAGAVSAEVARLRGELIALTTDQLTRAAVAAGVDTAAVGGLEPLAHALSGASESLANWWLDHPEEPAEAVAMRLMNFAWVGLGDLVRGRLWSPPEDPDDP